MQRLRKWIRRHAVNSDALEEKKKTIFISTLFMILVGGRAVSFLVSRIAPTANADLYAVYFQILCIVGSLFRLHSIQQVRLRFIVLFISVIGGLSLISLYSS